MGLQDSIEERTSIRFTVCAASKLFAKLSKEDLEALTNAVNKGIASRTLVESLAREGYKISNETFNAHRYGRCRCPKA